MNMLKISILSKNDRIAEAINRFLIHVLQIREVSRTSLADPYGQKSAFTKAAESDLLIVDGLWNGESDGFQFAKAMNKKVLILFYANTYDIELEGGFWIVLPHCLNSVLDKIKSVVSYSAPKIDDYGDLEKRFLVLRERETTHQQWREND